MATFQGAPGFPAVGQPISNVTVGQPISNATVTRPLTQETLGRYLQAVQAVGPNVYWRVSNPTRRLMLTGALQYVTRNFPNRTGIDAFVYWPAYRVAGTAREIAERFHQIPGFNMTAEEILSKSINPLSAQGRQYVEQQKSAAPEAVKAGPKHSLEEYIQIGNAIKLASKPAGTGAAAPSAAGARGGRSPDANRQRLINEFTQLMQQALTGAELTKVLNVSQFEPQKFTKAVRATPRTGPRATAVYPSINVGGRQIRVPVIAQPNAFPQFQAFVNSIIGASPYAQYVPEILRAFQTMAQSRLAPSIGQPAFGAPTMGGVSPSGGITPSSLGGVSPAPNIGGGFAAPSMTFAPSTVSMGGPLPPIAGLPALGGGMGLPALGGAGLPTLSGGALPRVELGGRGFPGVTLPPGLGASQ